MLACISAYMKETTFVSLKDVARSQMPRMEALNPILLTIQFCIDLVDELLVVSDKEIAQALSLIFSECNLVVEGAGALSLAAACKLGTDLNGKNNALSLSGGNVDPKSMCNAFQVSSID
jgi:threonine dehydratase